MKTVVLLLLPVVLFFSACRTVQHFESPNSMRNIEGTLYLQNGQAVTGKLVIQTDDILGSPVKVYEEGEKRPMKFRLKDIKGYAIERQYYEVKKIKETLSLGQQLYFMRRLTPESSRMHVYEHLKKEIVNKTATRYVPEYFVQLPNETEGQVYAADGFRFVPNFEEKMSRLVSDCARLAEKIREKKEGYFYAQVSLVREKRVMVLQRIIDEYNKCE
jgi:hypothetical protein